MFIQMFQFFFSKYFIATGVRAKHMKFFIVVTVSFLGTGIISKCWEWKKLIRIG